MMMMDPLVEMSFVAFLLLGSLLGSLGDKQNFPSSSHHQQLHHQRQSHPPHLLPLHERDYQEREFHDEVTQDAFTLTHSNGHLRKLLMAEGEDRDGGDVSLVDAGGGDRNRESRRLSSSSPGDFHHVTSSPTPHPSLKKFSYHRVVEERGGSRPYAAVTLEQDDDEDQSRSHPYSNSNKEYHNHPLILTEDFNEQRTALEDGGGDGMVVGGAVGRPPGRHHNHHHFHHIHHNHNHHHHHHQNSYHHRRSHDTEGDEGEGRRRRGNK